jgi:hypothetical protein
MLPSTKAGVGSSIIVSLKHLSQNAHRTAFVEKRDHPPRIRSSRR